MYNRKHISGKDKGDILVYALSTCVWCKKTRNLLEELGIGYDYIYVDLEEEEDQNKIEEEIEAYGEGVGFPTVIINGSTCISGYNPEKLRNL